jgi:hypothetical protein
VALFSSLNPFKKMKSVKFFIPSLCLVCFGFGLGDILAELDLKQADVENATFGLAKNNLRVPSWPEYNLGSFVKKARALPAGSRATAVKALGQIVKTYAMSEAFQAKWRAENAQVPNPAPLRAQLENERQRLAQANESTKAMQTQFKEMKANKEVWEMMQKNMTKEQLAEYEKAMQGGTEEGDEAAKRFAAQETKVKQAELAYAASQNPKLMVKEQLKKFVSLATSVDFQAQLTTKYSRQVFVNPEYEKKDNLWKLMYRAGPEAANAAREYAQGWLAELK